MLSVKQAAAYACVSETVVRGWLKDGLTHLRLGARGKRGKIAIQREDLDTWLAGFRVTNRPAPSEPAPARRLPAFKHLRLS